MTEGVRPKDCLTAALHHLVLASPDPEALASFYERNLGYRLEREGEIIIASGPQRRLVFASGPPNTLERASFALSDTDELDRLRRRIARRGWEAEDGPTPLFHDAVSLRDPDGALLSFGVPGAEPEPPAEKGKLSARLQHVVRASRQPEPVVAFFTEVLGFTVSDNVLDGEGTLRTSFLRCSAEHHSFAVFKALQNRFDHHCYETANWNAIRDWADHFAAQRIPLRWGPGRHGPGNNLFVFVHDPDGNWVEISAELEIVDHNRAAGDWPHEERTLNAWGQGLLRS